MFVRQAVSKMLRRGLRTDAYIGGEWVGIAGGEKLEVRNPANGEVLGAVPDLGEARAAEAVEAAARAFPAWAALAPRTRSRFLREWYRLVNDSASSLASILSSETGKPLDEALAEVNYGNSFLEWYSEEAVRVYGEVLGGLGGGKTVIHIKQPCGVAGIITPWNFPVAMVTRKVGAALAAGCTAVVKPAEDTPLSALALAELAHSAGIPPGVFNVITSSRNNAASVGKLLCQHPQVPVISFTGSTEVGKILAAHCSSKVKRVCLELGGNAPFVVFPSAHLDNAATGLVLSKFRNAGQTCVSPNRILVHSDVAQSFLLKLTALMDQKFYRSSGHFNTLALSPMINQTQLEKVERLVKEAVEGGAKVVMGGSRGDGLYMEPTVLTGVKEDMRVWKEEVFGPVVSIMEFCDEEEAVVRANATDRGLAAYVYSGDATQLRRVAAGIRAGMVGANESAISTPEAAFGGVKESGLGREGSHYGLEEFVDIKYICLSHN